MSNDIQTKILNLSNTQRFNFELFKGITLDLWTTMLAGAELIDLKNKAKADDNITVPEQNLINNQEQVLYTSIGMVAKDIVNFGSDLTI